MNLPSLGIDIGKSKFHAVLLLDGKAKSKACANSPSGFLDLFAWLAKQGAERVHACMEATGSYGEALASALFEAGHVVSVVNPARIKGFAQGELTRTKTDQVDAGVIARFCQAMAPGAWKPAQPEVRQLAELVRRLDDLVEMRRMEQNRLDVAQSPEVGDSIRGILARVEEEISKTERLIREHFDQHPGLKADRDLLMSIPGIGERTASVLLAEFKGTFRFSSARELAAFCGLTPRQRLSGTSVHGRSRFCKVGNRRVRAALYMPALVAIKANPVIRGLWDRLIKAGKPKMSAIGAAMRKLVHLAYGVLKTRKPFDPDYGVLAKA